MGGLPGAGSLPAHPPCPPGEPRGAAPVTLLQPLCQLHHREHHQSPEPQSHGHRGHVRCGPPVARGGEGGRARAGRGHGVMLGVDSGVHAVSITPTPSPTSTPHSSALEPWAQQPLGQRPRTVLPRSIRKGHCGGPGSLWPRRDPASPGSVSASLSAGGPHGGRVPPSSSSVQQPRTPLARGFPDPLPPLLPLGGDGCPGKPPAAG